MPKIEYRVYVIKLDPKVLEQPRFHKANPVHAPQKSCVYVGSTGLAPEERFKRHKDGIRANRYAREFGIGLMKSVIERREPARTKLAAVRKEAAMARRLRRAGYAVWPTDEAFRREIAKLEARRRERLAERARRRREHQAQQAAARRMAAAKEGQP